MKDCIRNHIHVSKCYLVTYMLLLSLKKPTKQKRFQFVRVSLMQPPIAKFAVLNLNDGRNFSPLLYFRVILFAQLLVTFTMCVFF